jgi:hypothetical protein
VTEHRRPGGTLTAVPSRLRSDFNDAEEILDPAFVVAVTSARCRRPCWLVTARSPTAPP